MISFTQFMESFLISETKKIKNKINVLKEDADDVSDSNDKLDDAELNALSKSVEKTCERPSQATVELINKIMSNVNEYGVLDNAQDIELINIIQNKDGKYSKAESNAAMEKMIGSKIKYIGSIAQSIILRHPELASHRADIVQTGLVGLWHLIEKFDTTRGVIFNGYIKKNLLPLMGNYYKRVFHKGTLNSYWVPLAKVESIDRDANKDNDRGDKVVEVGEKIADPNSGTNPEKDFMLKEILSFIKGFVYDTKNISPMQRRVFVMSHPQYFQDDPDAIGLSDGLTLAEISNKLPRNPETGNKLSESGLKRIRDVVTQKLKTAMINAGLWKTLK